MTSQCSLSTATQNCICCLAWLLCISSMSVARGQSPGVAAVASNEKVRLNSRSQQEILDAVKCLKSDHFAIRQSAFELLINRGIDSIEPLEEGAQTDDLETGTRCIEAIVRMAADKQNLNPALAALDRLANDSRVRLAKIAANHARELRLTDEDRAIAALEQDGARLFRGRDGKLFSITLQRDRDMKHLQYLPPFRALDLVGPGITDVGMRRLIGIKQLHSLTLMRTAVTAKGMANLENMELLASITTDGEVIDAWAIQSLKKLSRLRSISFVSAVRADQLKLLHEIPQIERLHLHQSNLDVPTIEILDQIRNLKTLSLNFHDIGDEQCQLLSMLKVPSNLTFTSCKAMTEEGWKSIGATNASNLFLHDTSITDNNLKHLASLMSLQLLGIHRAAITDEGLCVSPGLADPRGIFNNPLRSIPWHTNQNATVASSAMNSSKALSI